MRRRDLCFTTGLLLLAGSLFGAEPVATSPFATLYRQSDQGFDNRDLETWAVPYEAARYQFVDPKGKRQTLAEVREEWRAQMSLLRNMHSLSSMLEVRTSGPEAAVVAVEQRRTIELDGKAIKRPGLWVPVTIVDTVEDTWHRQGNSWKVVSTRELQHRQEIDPQWLTRQGQPLHDCSFNGC